MHRLDNFIMMGCAIMEEEGTTTKEQQQQQQQQQQREGRDGGKAMLLEKLRPYIYTSSPSTRRQRNLAGNDAIFPKQFMKGLAKAISADPLNKGSSPFGIGPVKHIESVTLADEFLVDQGIDINSINSALLEEACSARLIGGPGWNDDERKEALGSWLREVEITPREVVVMKK